MTKTWNFPACNLLNHYFNKEKIAEVFAEVDIAFCVYYGIVILAKMPYLCGFSALQYTSI